MKKAAAVALVAIVAAAGGWALLRGSHQEGAAGIAGTSLGASAAATSGPRVSVTTVAVQKRDVDVMLEATGTVTALNSVDVRPQIASTIIKVHIKEGQFVRAGEPLFTLDARSDEVNVTKAQAQLAKDLASLADAERQLARSKDLFAQNFISQGAVDTNQTLVESQRALRAFFDLVGERMADRLLLFLAYRGGVPIAGALNFVGPDTLYGRYWGCTEEVPFLHFELCYYQAIEWGIDHGLACVQAGAQGEHKIARGYEPVITKSAHFIPNRSFRGAVADFVAAERSGIANEVQWHRRELPYRSSE
jgi:multidrug efflux pump subunit AcrA (membrane-fusion protein)